MRLVWLGSPKPMSSGETSRTQPDSIGFERQAVQGERKRRIAALCKRPNNAALRRLSKLSEGGLAQLGEHLLCKQGVVGSIPSSSTKPWGQGSEVNVEVIQWLALTDSK